METNEFIRQLAAGATPVRRLPAPWIRMVLWLAVALPAMAVVMLFFSMQVDLARAALDPQFLVEEGATLATALAAGVAAFCIIIPGYSRKLLLLPLIPLAIWLASLGEGCLRDWLTSGAAGLALRPDWDCLLPAALIGIVPALVMVAMLRQGAPLFPRTTVALAALAVGALANFGLRLFHLGDASIMVLFWHFGTVAVLTTLAASLGGRILRWRHVVAKP
jgi:hypothetical protein